MKHTYIKCRILSGPHLNQVAFNLSNRNNNAFQLIGDEPPIPAGRRRRAPDRREISMRWLSGTFLTGLTSTVLMGAALFAALDGKQLLATPPEVITQASVQSSAPGNNAKTERLARPGLNAASEPSDRRRMSVSTVTRVGDADVIRTKPFEYLKVALAAPHKTDQSYPAFNPLSIFAETSEVAQDNESLGSLIYGAEVETEALIRTTDFVFNEDMKQSSLTLSDAEVEEIVRETAPILTDGSVEIASLYYVDPARFGVPDMALGAFDIPQGAKIVPQNVSVAAPDTEFTPERSFDEQLIIIRDTRNILETLENTGFGKAAPMADALMTLLRTEEFKEGSVIRLGLQGSMLGQEIVRASVYDDNEHRLTIALNDQEQYVPAQEPFDDGIMALQQNRKNQSRPAVPVARDLPTAYDAIYRSVLAYELPSDVAGQIVRMVAADVDFQSKINAGDQLELFYSVPEEGATGEAKEELLFVEATFNDQTRTFYRFRGEQGDIDYYDEEGRSARQFLLRNPVPNGKFRSPYGMRRHPILKYSRMHWGVDWSAPRGTPIIAPGNGVVKKAGWSNGYGKQTLITHANGYETSYSHQSKFAKGITPGARVRQGQVIGYIGTTGLSTGPHLHYEMRVNNKRVDPMRVRLPKGKSLDGEELERFIVERDRINDLLQKTSEGNQQIAQVAG
ncbi:M23 family metallopeptidase [Ahrensia marina]|uniref:M23 family metallopeptidase n=1 Tax=Ahrensia marina TaxID=1514904 RepID=UPI0009E9182A|nr:M23 family metallopeptidase [Ahrensia marina]